MGPTRLWVVHAPSYINVVYKAILVNVKEIIRNLREAAKKGRATKKNYPFWNLFLTKKIRWPLSPYKGGIRVQPKLCFIDKQPIFKIFWILTLQIGSGPPPPKKDYFSLRIRIPVRLGSGFQNLVGLNIKIENGL